MKEIFGFILGLVAIVAVQSSWVLADTPASFTGCAAHQEYGGVCVAQGAVFHPTGTAWLRGHVSPPHSTFKADVWCERPHTDKYILVDTVGISDAGVMHWAFHPGKDDAFPKVPWRFYFKIKGHGRSNTIVLYVRR